MKDMKWLYNMVITFFAAGCLTACSDYLEVDSNFKDRLTIEKVFTDKDYTDAWLSNTYSYLRGQNQDVGGKESVPTNFADDIYWADWNNEGNGKYTDADSIYRVSRQKVPDPNPKVQGSGKEYLGNDGKWYHESELIEFNKNGTPNPSYNKHGAKVTHIPVD